jgi:hypothetical protein
MTAIRKLIFFLFIIVAISSIHGQWFGKKTTTRSPHEAKAEESKQHPHGVHTGIITFSKKDGVSVDYESIKILLHPTLANRKIVVFSIIGAFRKGKSFLMDYCLRFMYANVSSRESTSGN